MVQAQADTQAALEADDHPGAHRRSALQLQSGADLPAARQPTGAATASMPAFVAGGGDGGGLAAVRTSAEVRSASAAWFRDAP